MKDMQLYILNKNQIVERQKIKKKEAFLASFNFIVLLEKS